jgi:hypothetical protein
LELLWRGVLLERLRHALEHEQFARRVELREQRLVEEGRLTARAHDGLCRRLCQPRGGGPAWHAGAHLEQRHGRRGAELCGRRCDYVGSKAQRSRASPRPAQHCLAHRGRLGNSCEGDEPVVGRHTLCGRRRWGVQRVHCLDEDPIHRFPDPTPCWRAFRGRNKPSRGELDHLRSGASEICTDVYDTSEPRQLQQAAPATGRALGRDPYSRSCEAATTRPATALA